MSSSIRDKQILALTSLLSLNPPTNPSGSGTSTPNSNSLTNALPVWKLLIMDTTARDVVSTSLKVQDLRNLGVTLHM